MVIANNASLTSLERVLTTLGHREPDRVPLFLLLSFYGAKELGMGIQEYFANPTNVVKAQLLMQKKYHNDCIYTFYYAALEVEAWGGEVLYIEEGPPNAGRPIITDIRQISTLKPPRMQETPCLQSVLEATRQLKAEVGNQLPIIAVAVSPFSVPVMQMGFENYLKLLYFHPAEFAQLMRINIDFTCAWANAQLQAGATAICYFDPLASPTIIERTKYLRSGYQVARETISQINGPVATHLASGLAGPVVEDIMETGSVMLGFSSQDQLVEIKASSAGRICLLGNLNAVEMMHWDATRIEQEVKQLIHGAGRGGGFILSDNHGEIPWQVPETVLLGIAEAVMRWGQYPLPGKD